MESVTTIICIFLFLIRSSRSVATASSGENDGGDGIHLWCVARNDADEAALQAALDWACSGGGVDCGAVRDGGVCFLPDDLQFHASFAFNEYYRRTAPPDPATCDFAGNAALTQLDPSVSVADVGDKCKFHPSLANGSSVGSGPVIAYALNGVGSLNTKPAQVSSFLMACAILFVFDLRR